MRLNPVVRGDHENHDVGDVGPTGTHRGESFVARGVEEGDRIFTPLHRVGPDVLGDASRFARGDFGAADGVKQGGLPVIDVTHEGDNGRARFEISGRNGLGLGGLDHRGDLVDSTPLFAFFR